MDERRESGPLLPFLAGALAGAAGAVLLESLWPRKGLDLRLIKHSREDPDVPPVVVVPGILGSELVRPDGSEAWLNLGNVFGSHDLSLPEVTSVEGGRDDLHPRGLLGVDRVLPRLFGFTEYADLLELLDTVGFRRDGSPGSGARYHVFTYDWRRDLVESARRLGESLDRLAERWGAPETRFTLVGHSMGGLVARYYLRYGGAEPGGPVTWAGSRRLAGVVLVATPNAGSLPALDSILNGSRVGVSTTTLSASVVSRLPSIYQLLPPRETAPLVDERGDTVDEDLLEPGTWEAHGWGPFATRVRRRGDLAETAPVRRAHRAFLESALARARAFHDALARTPDGPCPVRVTLLGGDCLPTLGKAVVSGLRGPAAPRFEPASQREAALLYEAGDGRVTRASTLAGHLTHEDDETACGMPEVGHVFLGDGDHHGLYRLPSFQNVLLRQLLRPPRRLGAALTSGGAHT